MESNVFYKEIKVNTLNWFTKWNIKTKYTALWKILEHMVRRTKIILIINICIHLFISCNNLSVRQTVGMCIRGTWHNYCVFLLWIDTYINTTTRLQSDKTYIDLISKIGYIMNIWKKIMLLFGINYYTRHWLIYQFDILRFSYLSVTIHAEVLNDC